MTEKELKKLNRQELLEVLLAQSKKIDRLQAQLKETKEKLAEKELKIAEAGSIAQASLVLNNIFIDAQKAADQYLENIRLMHKRAKAEFDAGEMMFSEMAKVEEIAEDSPAEVTEIAEDSPAEVTEIAEDSPAEVAEIAESSPTEVAKIAEDSPAEVAEISEDSPAEAVEKPENVTTSQRMSDEEWADRLTVAEAKAAAEADRKTAQEYLEEIRRLKERTELECAEKKRHTDKQIRISLIRTKKAIGQMMVLYADEVTKRMKRLKEWDRQMEALHERTNEKHSS